MGHMASKDVYGRLARKMDNLHVRAPWNDAFHAILTELVSSDEADLLVRMPFLFSSLDRVAKITRMSSSELRPTLDGLCEKGFVMDVHLGGEYRYMPNPMFVGFFEFTMMRTRGDLNVKVWAELFHEYMSEGAPYRANFGSDTKVSIARAVPHGESIADHVEVLDYEKAEHLIEEAGEYGIGTCSCRHKKEHAEGDRCDVPLETCTTLGHGADYLVRHGMSRKIDKAEALDAFARSKELGLVFCADNVRKGPMFVCHCCGCCCGIMDGVNVHGLTNCLVTSTLIAEVNADECNGCNMCVKACPVQALALQTRMGGGNGETKKKKIASVDRSFCIGCGVCGLKCPTGAVKLVKREQRVIHPE
ncbi:MAG: 4Fe-4S binding protein, partial [Desulfomonilaceae bacterium]|nr:4Fe-4S binding protein [Desulfomonilaceae bacterium]